MKTQGQGRFRVAPVLGLAGLTTVAAISLLVRPRMELHAPDPGLRERATETLGKAPLAFEANQGQSDSQVRFLARGGNHAVFLTPTEAVFVWDRSGELGSEPKQPQVLRLRFPGANPRTALVGLDPLPGKVNYLVGRESSRWRTGVATYARVEYRNLYPGIHLLFYGNQQGECQHDWLVDPGADVGLIRVLYEGVDRINIDREGDLVLHTGRTEIHQQRPVLYQGGPGEARHSVPGTYVSHGGSELGFRAAGFDPGERLVIDPVLRYFTRLGRPVPRGPDPFNNPTDTIEGIAVDATGNLYVTGIANTTDFPTSQPLQPAKRGPSDAFVTKLNAAGSALVYSTYLGSSGGDWGGGIAVDATGNAYVVGQTWGDDFPTVNPLQAAYAGNNRESDAFVAKLNPSGSALVYSTYLGGASPEILGAIAVDAAGSAYVAGWTLSTNFPTRNPLYPTVPAPAGFVSKLSPAGSALVYSTYIPGVAAAMALDAEGSVYVTGTTASRDFPTTPGAFQTTFGGAQPSGGGDAFVLKLNPAGSALTYSTYLGGSSNDEGHGIAADAAGSAYVTGRTISNDFPGAPGSGGAFVTKLNPAGSTLLYSTRLGGVTEGNAVAVDAAGNAYVAGYTLLDIPLVRPFQGGKDSGLCEGSLGDFSCADGFVAKLSPDGSARLYSSYLGGTGNDYLTKIVVDRAGNAYVAGVTNGYRLPLVNPFSTQGFGLLAKIEPEGDVPAPAAVANGASFARAATPPGSIASLFGINITNVSGIVLADGFPLPTELRGTSVTVNGVPAPILGLANVEGREQINFQVPYEFRGDGIVVVTRNGVTSLPVFTNASFRQIDPYKGTGPAIFTTEGTYAAVQHGSSFELVAPANPAERGEVVVVYATGLGDVDPPVRSGHAAPVSPLSRTVRTWDVWVGGTPFRPDGARAEVLFSGLTPGYAGLYQLNIRIPENVPSGDARLQIGYNPTPSTGSIGSPYGNVVKLPVR